MAYKNFGEANSYCPNGFIEQDVRRNGEWRETVKDDYWLIPQSRDCLNNYLQDAKVVRDIFRDYFQTWQLKMSKQHGRTLYRKWYHWRAFNRELRFMFPYTKQLLLEKTM